MSTGARPATEEDSDPRPDVAACESRPGKVVFIESDNSDGWIASDTTLDLEP